MSPVGQYSYSVEWSEEDQEYVGLCLEFPSLSWLDKDQQEAFLGIRNLVAETVADMTASGEDVPEPIALRSYSGTFKLRIAPVLHRELAKQAARNHTSLNGYIEMALGLHAHCADSPRIYRRLKGLNLSVAEPKKATHLHHHPRSAAKKASARAR